MTTRASEISRRDLFRGRLRSAEPSRSPSDAGALGPLGSVTSAPPPKSISHPEVTEPEPGLPPVTEATLCIDQLEALLRDIRLCATEIQLINRGGPDVNQADGPDLQSSMDRLLRTIEKGGMQAAQLRYRWNNVRWIDTISRIPGGIRLIRVGHPT